MFFVGVARLERATACTPCKNASQLHHTPIIYRQFRVPGSYKTENPQRDR